MQELKKLNCLILKTQKILLDLIQNAQFLKKYVFVGGSAIALQLGHRQSEDLDFFTYEEMAFDKEEIFKFI